MTTEGAPEKPISKLGLFVPWLVIAGLFAAYGGVWLFLAEGAKQVIQSAVARAPKEAGARVGAIKASGFPIRLSLTLSDVAYRNEGTGWGLGLGSVRITAMPWDMTHWIADRAEGPVVIDPGNGRWQVTAPALEASVHWDANSLRRFSAIADKSSAQKADGTTVTLQKAQAHLQADPNNPSQLAFVIDAVGIGLPGTPDAMAVLGPEVEKLRLAGLVPDGQNLLRSPSRWLGAGGRFEPKDGTIHWGPLQVKNITGALSVGQNGLVQGNLAGQGGLVAGGTNLAGPLSLTINQGSVQVGRAQLFDIPPFYRPQSSR